MKTHIPYKSKLYSYNINNIGCLTKYMVSIDICYRFYALLQVSIA